MNLPQLENVIASFKKRVENALSIKVQKANIDVCLCDGYVVLSFENDEYVVNAEISECANQFILTGFEIFED